MTTATSDASSRTLLHPLLIAPGSALLIAAFATDLLYWRTVSPQWETFSIWLLTGGLIIAGLAGLALLLDVRLGRVRMVDRWRFAAVTAAALLSLLNAFIHSRDGYTAVVPQGLWLSAIVTALLLVTGWRGWSLADARPLSLLPFQEVRS
ncbi:MAG: hypothetical protein JWN66_37 [Sphingomonas bacterium]|uniref:DUF2231 domain-containing protein n=1 Tax=Sphingomonas bacterium TaxID=1895847 RepID=UPI002608B0DD|nr:DUF2231 domain-containing protein [Sphingomonas bacterium]MDB5702921.1 hypothetical protein [Sphingomonas bacterium]